ncbi:MAG: alanine racemase [Patescibacteria group bacterium]|jgi:alanine racemase
MSRLKDYLRKIIKPKYESLNVIKIETQKIIANYNYLKQEQRGAEIIPVLKSNAYGHGLKEVCQILNQTSAKLVAVDSFPEAQIVWRYFKGKVLILNEMPLKVYSYCRLARTEFVVYSQAVLKHLAKYGEAAKVHLFYNTGMNREGIKDLAEFLKVNESSLKKVKVTGFCSHLSSAEEETIINQDQEDKFLAGLLALREQGLYPTWVHLGNSASVFKSRNSLLTAYRAGLALYGYSPFAGQVKDPLAGKSYLRPALSLYSTITHLQTLQGDEAVSYNADYITNQETKIAIIPLGYFEGLDRRLSNQAQFIAIPTHKPQERVWARVAGKVCMNLTCLDLGLREIRVGDRVLVISPQTEDPNSVQNLAKIMGTISYEVLVKLQANIRREIIW